MPAREKSAGCNPALASPATARWFASMMASKRRIACLVILMVKFCLNIPAVTGSNRFAGQSDVSAKSFGTSGTHFKLTAAAMFGATLRVVISIL